MLAGCDTLPEGVSQQSTSAAASGRSGEPASVAAASASEPQAASDDLVIQHYVDISGCWRPVGPNLVYSDGASFTIFAIASNTFVLGKDAHTSYVVSENLSFVEGNRDPDKPFYPPGYVHSTGVISEDGLAITRNLVGQSGSKEYRRCANVQQAPPGLRNPDNNPDETEETPEGTPIPRETIAPLISRLNPTPTPSQAPLTAVPEPTPEASSEPTPEAPAL